MCVGFHEANGVRHLFPMCQRPTRATVSDTLFPCRWVACVAWCSQVAALACFRIGVGGRHLCEPRGQQCEIGNLERVLLALGIVVVC